MSLPWSSLQVPNVPSSVLGGVTVSFSCSQSRRREGGGGTASLAEVGRCPEWLLMELGLGDTSLPPAHGMQLAPGGPQA